MNRLLHIALQHITSPIIRVCGALVPLTLVCCLMPAGLSAQGGIGINADGASPDPAAILDMNATALPGNNKKGLLPPNAALNQTLYTTAASNPFRDWLVGSMFSSLWINNTNTLTLSTGSAAYQWSVDPGHYWFDVTRTRWIRQENAVMPTQYHQSTDTVLVGGTVLVAPGVWEDIPGLNTLAYTLAAGDRVQFSADGALRCVNGGYSTAVVRVVRVEGVTVTELIRTTLTMNTTLNPITSSFCFLPPLFCTNATPTGSYDTYLGLGNWRLFGQDQVAAAGTYTYKVQVGRIDGTADVRAGGTASVNSDRISNLKVEVLRR